MLPPGPTYLTAKPAVLILLLSISEQDNQMLHTFFDWLSNVLIDYNQLMQFIEADNYQQFMKLMTA